MISRRFVLVGGTALAAIPVSTFAFADTQRLTLSGTMEQGSLVVGTAEAGARVTFDDLELNVSPEGLFACGIAWDRTSAAHLSVRYKDGSVATRDIVPVQRQYNVQHVDGLPQNTVTPPADVIDRIKRENAQIGAARHKDSDSIAFSRPFDWPAPGIMSGVFGSQRIDNGRQMSPHMGVDMANVEGTPIHAPADATVSISDDFYLDGGFTLLDHGHGVSTCYLHQSRRTVQAGDVIKRGQIIGLIGKTGRATGPHLHWAMNWFQVKLDPSRSTATPVPPRT